MDFEHIYRLYFKDVFLYLRALSASADTAEEITQETFVKALRSIDSFDGSKDIRAWLFTIARNTYYTHCRRQSRYADEELSEMSRIYSRILQSGLRTKRAPFRSTGSCTAWTNPIKKYSV